MKRLNAELNDLIKASGKSINQVAAHGRVDRAYLSRLLTGEKVNPSPETLMRIWIGIVFDEKLLAREPELTYGLERLVLASMWTSAGDKLLSDVGAMTAASAD